MSMKVICYGDSNTYGYDPRSYFGGRYGIDCRWVDILAHKTGWEIQNKGMNGREIPPKTISVPEDTDLLVVMLGTNDLLQGNSVRKIAKRMEAFLSSLPSEKLLLIAPPPMKLGEWVPNQEWVDRSIQVAKTYRSLAEQLGIPFMDAGEWNVSLAHDGVHFTEEGHKAFAEGMYRELKNLNNKKSSFFGTFFL